MNVIFVAAFLLSIILHFAHLTVKFYAQALGSCNFYGRPLVVVFLVFFLSGEAYNSFSSRRRLRSRGVLFLPPVLESGCEDFVVQLVRVVVEVNIKMFLGGKGGNLFMHFTWSRASQP